jgi:hypothetical protein
MIPHMRAQRLVLLVGLLVVATPGARASSAQSGTSSDSIGAVADSFFRATEQERWRDAARLIDLATFGALRDQELANMRSARKRMHQVTPEELMKFDPRMPRVVASYQAARANEQLGRNDWLSHEYANVSSADSLAALSPLDAAARWLEARDSRYMMRQALVAQRDHCEVPDSILEQTVHLTRPTHRRLGTVAADSLAYVLYTEDLPPEPDSASAKALHARQRSAGATYVISPPVLTLRRVSGQWRIAPSFGMSTAGSAVISCDPKPPARKQTH